MSNLNIKKMSDEEFIDLFTECYQKQVASYNNVYEFECDVSRPVDGSVKVEVMVVGLAGTPTPEKYKELEGTKNVIVSRDDEELVFDYVPEEDYVLNNNDYKVVYVARR